MVQKAILYSLGAPLVEVAYAILLGMKRGLRTEAYTIIEVLIVLAVTGVLLVAAMLVMAGQQRKTEFSQSIHDIESQVSDTMNDVSTGFYPNTNNFSCTATPSGPALAGGSGVTNNQGANKGCIFIGRVMQFGIQGASSSSYNVYTVVGQRQINNQEVTTLTEAKPVTIAPALGSPSDFPNATDPKTLQYGLSVKKMTYTNGGAPIDISTVGFFSTFASYSGVNLVSGNPSVDLMPIDRSSLGVSDSPTVVTKINSLDKNSVKNPSGGVAICFQSGGTDQYGVLTIGSNNRQLSTKLDIYNSLGEVPPALCS